MEDFSDHERLDELMLHMLQHCVEPFEGAPIRDVLEQMRECFDVSLSGAQLLLIAFKAGMLFGQELTCEPCPN